MNIIQSILTKNPCYTAGRKITVKGLMLHSVGCSQPKASVFVNNWNSPSYSSACVHAFIDGNTGDIYQTLPWDHRGWHGGGDSNNTHIGVEMCEPACIKYTGGATFTCSDKATAQAVAKRTYQAAVELFAYLCKQYGLDPLKDGVILSHKEGHARGIASNHGDPEHLWTQLGMGYTMDTFRAAVKAQMSGTTPAPATPPAASNTAKEDGGMDQEKFNQMFNTAMQQYRQNLRDNDSGTWSEDARKFVIDEGIFVGSGTTPDGTPNFMWEDLLTREQCAQVLYRFAQKYGLA